MNQRRDGDAERLTYAAAGVDVDRGNAAVARLGAHVRRTHRPGVLGGLGGFGGLFELDVSRYPNPVLVSGTDGVGTKLKVAFAAGRHNTVGQDLVAMCANDVAVQGAEPLFFLDYIATARIDPVQIEQIVAGIADGCALAGCALLGGETAELPGLYAAGEYDLAGFCVGVVSRERIIDGSRIRPGDALVGLASAGLHSNGYSLARRVLLRADGGAFALAETPPALGRSVADELLQPTRIYARTLLKLYAEFDVRGAAHITGGGLSENVPRMLPAGCRARLDAATWPVPPVFGLIQQLGRVEPAEMLRTFNMGLGMVLAVPAAAAAAVAAAAVAAGEQAFVVGEVVAGETGVEVSR